MSTLKRVYFFGGKRAEGDGSMRELLGGKGANLAEMCRLQMPVPAGFTITTDTSVEYYESGMELPEGLREEVEEAIKGIEECMGTKFGDSDNPLLLSTRSGARISMPGMMETVLNIGLSSETIPGLIKRSENPRFVYDAYRRLITMYADVVLEKGEEIEPKGGVGIRVQLENLMQELKDKKGYQSDNDLTTDDLIELCENYKSKVVDVLGRAFPDDPEEQLWGSIAAVFKSWNGARAVAYRKIENIPNDWGTAVNVQAMVFGNMGDTSATGVAFSRNPATGEKLFYGEWLINAQGEDVVAGTRTPNPLNNSTKGEQNRHLVSLEEAMPDSYRELDEIQQRLESHYKDMQDIEFTIERGKLWMLQCRVGKRTGVAALNMAMDMLEEGLIDEKTSVMRVDPTQLDELLHPILDPSSEAGAKVLAKGLPAGPGGAVGKIVLTSEAAIEWTKRGEDVLLVREETNPEDVEGMRAAVGLLTSRGGMTSHAALVARGWGKCCIVGCDAIKIDVKNREISIDGVIYKEGTLFSLNGSKGIVYEGVVETIEASENRRFVEYMEIADKYRTLGVRANADTPEDAKRALEFGAEGLGLFRIEHMFYGIESEVPLSILRKVILSDTKEARVATLNQLEPYMKEIVLKSLRVMNGRPFTIRLLDPPLHEFVAHSQENQRILAKELGITIEEVIRRNSELTESNPMMGHRGVRLGITYPEISETQFRAIFEAIGELVKEGENPQAEIMIPVTISLKELEHQKELCKKVHREVERESGVKIPYQYGTMIEIPRAVLLADELAKSAQFFSYGTNDLTQMTFGFSRDDTGSFMSDYLQQKMIDADPFQTIDQPTVGKLIETGIKGGRTTNPKLKIGICGEHGGDPASIEFCHKVGMNYVSCSPFRVPIARLAAAQAAIKSYE